MLEPGSVFGPFVIEGLLGEGGMGCVYRARDRRLERLVALKLVRQSPSALGTEERAAAARLMREARAAAQLLHPNIVVIHEAGELEGVPFIAMELVRGRALRAFVGDPTVTPERRERWLLEAARGLGAAHAAGLVHRDVKPENALVSDEDDRLKLADFGIARTAAGAADPTAATVAAGVPTLTALGTVVGSPRYMSPEQLRGEDVDGRSDQFAWGVMAYELLSGELPWHGATTLFGLAAAIAGETPAPLPAEVPAALRAAVERALAKRPDDRFPSMAALLAALAPSPAEPTSLAPGRPTPTPAALPTGAVAEGAPRAKPTVRRLTVGFALGALVLGAVGALAVARRSATPGAPAAAERRMLQAPAPKSSSAEALAAYRAGLQRWHDGGSLTSARDELAKAGRLDPALAAAHLRAAYLSFRYAPQEGRVLLSAASRLRADLDEHDRALLEVVTPLFAEPAAVGEVARRAEAALSRYPGDEELGLVLLTAHLVRYDVEAARAVAERMAAADPTNGEVAWTRAVLRVLAGDAAGGRALYDACLRDLPGATSCLWNRMLLSEAEGRCPELLDDARAWTAIEPEQPLPYAWMAKAHAALGAYEAAREALAQRWQRLPAGGRELLELGERARLAVLTGDLREAERAARALEQVVAASGQLAVRRDAALLLGFVLEETGQRQEAAERVGAVLAKRGAWASSSVYAPVQDDTTALSGIAHRAGKLDDDAFAELREKTFAEGLAWFLRQGAPRTAWAGRVWLSVYAMPSETAAEAAAAFAALPAAEPLPDLEARSAREQLFYARALSLHAPPARALPELERATRSCVGLDWPVFATRALYALGEARAGAGDLAGACAAHGQVIARWGRDGRSVTAQRAAARRRELRCDGGGR